MRQKTKAFITVAIVAALALSLPASAQISSPNYWKLQGTALSPLNTSWIIGTSTARIPNIFATNADISTLTIGTTTISSLNFTNATGTGYLHLTGAGTALSVTNNVSFGNIVAGIWQGTAIGDAYISSAATWNAKITTTSLSVAYPPLSYDNNTGVFSLPTSTAGQSGFLSASDWTTFNSKQPLITFPIAVASTSLTGGVGLTLTANDLACDTATASVFGCLASADWTTFNDKQNAISFPVPVASTSLAVTTPLSLSTNQLSIPTSTASQSGFLSATDWATFNAKITTTSLSASAPIVYDNATGAFSWTNSPGYITTSSLSSTATGLTYNNATGVFSLTGGYEIPTVASTTNWEGFYQTPSTRITAGTNLSWVGNTLNAISGGINSLNGSTSSTQTFATSSDTNVGITIGTSNGVHTFTPTWIGTLADDRIASAATWNAKEPAISAGTSAQYWRGDKTFQTLNTTAVAEGTNLYYTDARARAVWGQDLYATSTVSFATANITTANIGTVVVSGLVDGNLIVGGSTATSTITNNGTISTIGGNLAVGSGNSYFLGNLSVGSSTAPTTGVAFFNGNVGIGTTTPAQALSVVGNALFSGTLTASGYNSTNWDTAYTDRLKWNGGATGLVAATGRASLELTDTATTASSTFLTKATNYKSIQWSASYTSSTTQFDDPIFTFKNAATISNIYVTSRDASNTVSFNFVYSTDPTISTSTSYKVFSTTQTATSTPTTARNLTPTASSTPAAGDTLRLYSANASSTITTFTIWYYEN